MPASGTLGDVTTNAAYDPREALRTTGPLSREQAAAVLDYAAQCMTSADFMIAAHLYARVIGVDDLALTAAALLGSGEAFHRLDDESSALAQWETAARLAENRHTYAAWRNVAAARVRSGDLRGAITAYKEADRRAPREEKAEIAARLGWLTKEVGDKQAAGRYFARARGDVGLSAALVVIGITTAVSLLANFLPSDAMDLYGMLQLDKVLIVHGELWRLVTVTLLHAPLLQMPLHLPMNMYAIWIAGPFIERLYGRSTFLAVYLVTAVGASLATFAFSDAQWSVGASGGVFGLFGFLIGMSAVHKPMLDRAARGFLGQLVGLVVLNLVLGLTMGTTDNWAHVGGLISGLWLGVLLPPTNVETMRSMWRRPGPTPGTTVPALGSGGNRAAQVAGIVVLVVLFGILWGSGLATWA